MKLNSSGITQENYSRLAKAISEIPADFKAHSTISNILKKRKVVLASGEVSERRFSWF